MPMLKAGLNPKRRPLEVASKFSVFWEEPSWSLVVEYGGKIKQLSA
jgi:hypothetical protein